MLIYTQGWISHISQTTKKMRLGRVSSSDPLRGAFLRLSPLFHTQGWHTILALRSTGGVWRNRLGNIMFRPPPQKCRVWVLRLALRDEKHNDVISGLDSRDRRGPAQSHDWGMATDYAFIVHLCRTSDSEGRRSNWFTLNTWGWGNFFCMSTPLRFL